MKIEGGGLGEKRGIDREGAIEVVGSGGVFVLDEGGREGDLAALLDVEPCRF